MNHNADGRNTGSTAPRRKRGGQLGNVNALKHGFYARQFRDLEITDLDAFMENGLHNEIAMLRVATRRVFEMADGDKSLDEMVGLLGTLGMAATRLAGLLKTQKLLAGENDGMAAAISQALSEVVKELGLQ